MFWVEPLLMSFLIPGVSWVGHVAGAIVGSVYCARALTGAPGTADGGLGGLWARIWPEPADRPRFDNVVGYARAPEGRAPVDVPPPGRADADAVRRARLARLDR